MQTFTQTFAGAQTWTMNIPGAYFVTLQCTNPINVRLFKGGKKLDLGDMTGLLAGLEIGPLVEPGQIGYQFAFDRVEIDVTGADTIKIGIGNGAARYARLNGSMDLLTIQAAAAAVIQRPELPTANYSNITVLAANTAVQVVAPAANTNGIIILGGHLNSISGGNNQIVLIAKNGTPATVIDGDVIMAPDTIGYVTGTGPAYGGSIKLPQYIAAGNGLYFIATTAELFGSRNIRYRIL